MRIVASRSSSAGSLSSTSSTVMRHKRSGRGGRLVRRRRLRGRRRGVRRCPRARSGIVCVPMAGAASLQGGDRGRRRRRVSRRRWRSRDLAGDRVARAGCWRRTREFTYRPMTVAEPFALAPGAQHPLADVAARRRRRARRRLVRLGRRPAARRAHRGRRRASLRRAAARTRRAHARAVRARDRRSTTAAWTRCCTASSRTSRAATSTASRSCRRRRMGWPLPLYELALLTARRAYEMGVDARGHGRDARGDAACDLRRRGVSRSSPSCSPRPASPP